MAGLDNSSSGIPTLTTTNFDASGGGTGSGLSNAELMEDARASLSGNWGMAVLGYFLYTLFSAGITFFGFSAALFVGVVSGISGSNPGGAGSAINGFAQLFQGVICGPLIVGFYGFYLGIAQDDEACLERLFIGFRRFWKSFVMYLLSSLFIILWSLLLVIPGVIAMFRYSMAFFIIADDEACGPLEAITRSKEIMKGNKWKFFCLNCRFIGWILLASIFTLGLGYLWLIPYMHTSYAKFYEDVK